MAKQKPHFSQRRYILLLALLVMVLYVVIPQLGSFRSSWQLLGRLNFAWVAVAVTATFLTYLAAAGTYYFLALKPLRYGQLILIEMTAMFVNRLLPAGIGALGTNYAYLRQRCHSQSQAATVVAANNLTGVAGHLTITAITLAAYGPAYLKLFWHQWAFSHIFLKSILVLAVVLAVILGRKFIASALESIRRPVYSYLAMPHKLIYALITSMILTLCNLFCLEACSLALGVHVPFIAILVVFSFGLGAATATPTPGGLGGFEAGLFGGLVAYHVASPTALALVLLYRLVSFWLPLIAGGMALAVAQRKKLFNGYI